MPGLGRANKWNERAGHTLSDPGCPFTGCDLSYTATIIYMISLEKPLQKYVFFELKDVLSPVHCTCNKPGPGNEVLVLSNVFWCEVTRLSVVSAIVYSLLTKYAECLVQK